MGNKITQAQLGHTITASIFFSAMALIPWYLVGQSIGFGQGGDLLAAIAAGAAFGVNFSVSKWGEQ